MGGDGNELVAFLCPLVAVCLLDLVEDLVVLVILKLELCVCREAVRNGDLVIVAFLDDGSEIVSGKIHIDLIGSDALCAFDHIVDPCLAAVAGQSAHEGLRQAIHLSSCTLCEADRGLSIADCIVDSLLVVSIDCIRIRTAQADRVDRIDNGLNLALQRLIAASVILNVLSELRSILSSCLVSDEVNSSVELLGDILGELFVAVIGLLAVGEHDIVGSGLVVLAVIDLNRDLAGHRELVPVQNDRIAVCIDELDAASGERILCDGADDLVDALDAHHSDDLARCCNLDISIAEAVDKCGCLCAGHVGGSCQVSDDKLSCLCAEEACLDGILVAQQGVHCAFELIVPVGLTPLNSLSIGLLAFDNDRELVDGRKRADIGIHRDIGQPGLVKDGAGSAVSCVDVDACRGKLAHEEHGTGCGCEHTLKK